MADDTERLVVLLEARIRDFEKNMQRASGTAGQQYGRMRRDSRSATANMEQDMIRSTSRINQALASSTAAIGAYGKAFATGLVGGIAAGGIAGMVNQVQQIARSVAQVGDEAKRAGVSLEAFQEWKFVAEQNRIGIDQMVDGLKELNLRADEFVQTGKGSAAEAFMRLGYGAEELQRKLKNPSELLLEIIDRLGQMDRAAQIRISDELFGGSAGERFVELLDQGEQGIRDTIQQAHQLGAVMDQELVDRAAELDRKFNAITTSVSTGLKTAIVEAADAMQEFIDKFRGWWGEFEKRRGAAIAGAQVGAMAGNTDALDGVVRTTPKTDRLPEAPWTPPEPPPGGFGSSSSTSNIDRQARELERMQEMANRRLEMLRESLMTEEEAERNSYANRMLQIQEFEDAKMVSKAEADEMTEAAHLQHHERMAEISRIAAEQEIQYREQVWMAVADTLGGLSALMNAFGEKHLAAAKALAIGEAIINTAVGITAALRIPGPLGWAQAAAVAASGAAQVATIMNSRKGGGRNATVSGSGATASASESPAASGGTVNLQIQGLNESERYSGAQVRELMDKMVELQRDGYRLVTVET